MDLQAYKLLLTAAGYLSYLEEKCAPLLQPVNTSADCTQQVRRRLWMRKGMCEVTFEMSISRCT